MAFVNEYVSGEDVQKYNLDEVWLHRNPVYRREGKLPPGFRHKWTVDRERNFYFMVTGGGGYDRGNITECVLYLDGVLLNVELAKPGEGSKSFSEQPYRIVWELNKMLPKLPDSTSQEAVRVLKDALRAYGYAGARRQIPNTIVEFKF